MISYYDSVEKCGYLGLGHMGFPVFQASYGYFLANKWVIFCVDRDENRLSKITHTSINKSNSLPNRLEILFLGVRPQDIQEIAKTTSDPKMIISMVAGVTCDTINGIWPTSHVIRIIPNTPCEYGVGITPIFVNKISIDNIYFKTVIGALSGLGKIIFVSSENMIGGIVGLWIAAESTKRGFQVELHEKYEIGHGKGSSHGDSRIFRTAYWECPEYVVLARKSRELWAWLNQYSKEVIYDECGGVYAGSKESALVKGALNSANFWQIDVSVRPLESIGFVANKNHIALEEKHAGIIYANRALLSLKEYCISIGMNIFENSATLIKQLAPSSQADL